MGTRLATTDDFDVVFDLLSELHSSPLRPEVVREQLEHVVNDPERATILAITDDGTPVGVATVNIVYRLAKLECRIDEVVVSGTVRGQGFGTVLMLACEQWAWDHGAEFTELTSRASREAANHLYQKLGYKLHETNVYEKSRPA